MVRQIVSQMNDMNNEFQRQMHAMQELMISSNQQMKNSVAELRREFIKKRVTNGVEETSQTSDISTEFLNQNSDQQTSDQSVWL